MPTLSYQRPGVDVRCRLLAPGWRVKDIADACRSAGLAFAWCAHRAWNKRELARWLVGPYAAAVGSNEEVAPRRSVREPIEDSTIRDLLASTHAQLIAELSHFHAWKDDPSFAREMVDAGLVIGVVDENDAIGYAPQSGWNMRLIDRVRSLFVADYLTRPDDYESFTICEGCGGATFDGAESHRATCPEATPPSGLHSLVLRRRSPTLSGIGEEEELAIDLTRTRGERRRRTTLDFAGFADEDFDDDDTDAVDLTAELNAAIRAA